MLQQGAFVPFFEKNDLQKYKKVNNFVIVLYLQTIYLSYK